MRRPSGEFPVVGHFGRAVNQFYVTEFLGKLGDTTFSRVENGLFASTDPVKEEVCLLDETEMTIVSIDPSFKPWSTDRLDGVSLLIIAFLDGGYSVYRNDGIFTRVFWI